MSKKKGKIILEWEVSAPVIKSRLFWSQMTLMVGVGALFVMTLLLGLNLYEGQWDQIPDSLMVGGSLFAGMFLFVALIALLMFSRGASTRYEMSDAGIYQHTLQNKGGWLKWLALFGVLSGKSAGYTAAGATLLSDARSTIFVRWKDIKGISTQQNRGEILLEDGWHTRMQVFCPAETYDHVLERIQSHLVDTHHSAAQDNDSRDPSLAHQVLLTLFGTVFGIFLLPRLPIEIVPVFTLVMMIAFLIMLWSHGTQAKITAIIALVLSIALPAVSATVNGVNLHKDGSMYAVAIEVLLYVYFACVSCDRIRKLFTQNR